MDEDKNGIPQLVQGKPMSEFASARNQAQGESKVKSEFAADIRHELRPPMSIDFELLRSRFNEGIIKQLLTMFVESAQDEVSRIEKSLARQAYIEVREQAHAFRGACGTICATELLQNCREMEAAAGTADKQHCDDLFATLKTTLRSTLTEIGQRLVDTE